MTSDVTSIAEFNELTEVKTTLDPVAFAERLEQLHQVAVRWHYPYEDANFISSFKIPGPDQAEYLELVFSLYGNLVFLRVRGKPRPDVVLVREMLHSAGWRIIEEELENLVLNEWGETVYGTFFHYF